MDPTATSHPRTPMAVDEVLHAGSGANTETESGHCLPIVSHVAPDWMEPHAYEMSFEVPRSIDSSWRWLNDPDTFICGQIWPYRVEFVSPDPAVPPGFHVGVLNTHHGPWMNFAGVITEVRPMEYRDLHYFYGAYAFGPRWVRPTRLQFWTKPVDSGTQVRLRVDSHIRKGWARSWTWMQSRFWQRFPKWMRRGIDATETANCP